MSEQQTQAQQKEEELNQQNDDEVDVDDAKAGTQKLSKGQKKKLKAKQQEQKKKAEEPQKKVEEEEKVVTNKKGDKKGAKKGAGAKVKMLEKIQQEQEEQNKQLMFKVIWDIMMNLVEDAMDLAEAEQEKKIKEEKALRKLKKKEKIQEMKNAGTYLTSKQRFEMERLNNLKLIQQGQQTIQTTPATTEEEQVVENKDKAAKKIKQKKIKRDIFGNVIKEDTQIQKDTEKEEQQQEQKEKQENQQQNQEKQLDEVEDWLELVEDKEKEEKKQQQEQKNANSEEKLKKPKKKKEKVKAKADEDEEEKIEVIQKNYAEPITNEVIGEGKLRSPICCILGHVDTGKTTILDKIRNTNVQQGEAGGITQQIGATFFPAYKIQSEIDKLKSFYPVGIDVPGILIIDTPGHESFSNLRSRGSSLCDLAILVIDLMHGIEKQTMESIELLKMRKTPFIIALNKIDRIYDWKIKQNESSFISLQSQTVSPQTEFKNRFQETITQLAEKGFNAALYWDNQDITHYVSIVPTSGVTGEGLPDLLGVIMKYSQKFLKSKIKLRENQFSCTVLEVKMIEGLSTTIDCILVDGIIREGDKIVLLGFDGPIVTSVKALLTPHPMKESRVKGEYIHHKELHASMGLKISAQGLETAVAGCQLYVIKNEEEEEFYKEELMQELKKVKKSIKLQTQGVCVAASTLGSLEALLVFLKQSDIPVSYVRVGPVSKEDVMKAMKTLLVEDPNRQKKEYAAVLAFDIKILPEAQKYAEDNGISIFTGNIIYHLFDQYTVYIQKIQQERKENEGKKAVFPCILKPVAFFNKKDPIIMGVDVEKGVLRKGTPICVYDQNKLKLGTVESIESNHKQVNQARKETGSVAIKIQGDPNIVAQRHFDLTHKFASIQSRESFDVLKEYFRDELTDADWDLCRDLKRFFQII